MSKPAKLPRWATDANRTVEPPENGGGVTTKDNGFQEGTRPPARYFNWLFLTGYQWFVYLDQLNDQEFTNNGVGEWSKAHAFVPSTPDTIAGSFQGSGTAHGVYASGGSDGGNGVRAYAHGNDPAGFFFNTLSGPGVVCAAGADGQQSGGVFYGGEDGGNGISASGGSNGDGAGVYASGSGAGNGVVAVGGPTGVGVSAIGGSGASVCHGVVGTAGPSGGHGGLFIGKVNQAGVRAEGAGGAPGTWSFGGSGGGSGGTFTGGANGHGVVAGGSGTGYGITATGGSSGTGGYFAGTVLAIEIASGNARFSGAQLAPTATPPVTNYLCPTNIQKAWGSVLTSPGGGGGVTLTISDAYNIASLSMSPGSNFEVVVTFARPMANATYSITYGSYSRDSMPYTTGKLTTGFTFRICDVSTPANDHNLSVAPSHQVDFQVSGRQ